MRYISLYYYFSKLLVARVRVFIVQILIDNKQHYKVLGKPVDLTTLIRLHVEDGKVVKHEDWYVRDDDDSYNTMSHE